MPGFIDLTGQRFERWFVLERVSNDRNSRARWLCLCDCGQKSIVYGNNLRNGHSTSCRSCQISRRNKTHGQRRTKLYQVWASMIDRCENPNTKSYKHYGSKGIKVCLEWRNDFMAFRKWALANGYKEGLTIDRIDNDKGYFPENCQFITLSENTSKAWRIDGSHKERLKCTNIINFPYQ